MTIKEQAEMQTPDAPSTELQNQTQMNKVYVAPEAQNYATSGKVTQAGYQNADTTHRLQNWDAETTRNKMNNTNQSNTQVTTPTEVSNVNNQTVQPIQNQSNIAVKIPSDLYDQTVQGYLNEYNKGKEINDYQAQINALNAIDQYRTSQGYAPIYTSNVYELMNQRTEKIKNAIREYETDMASATYSGDEVLAQQIGQQMEAYKRSVNYQETLDNASNYLANIEYKSVYDTTINDIVNELLTSRFTYDPSDDKALLKAQQYATNSVYESMNAKGILDSTMTAQIVTNTVNELIPVYEKMSKEEFYNNIERLQSMANLVINLDDRQYQRWQDNVQNKLDYYSAKKDEINYQWDRVNKLGYVDNEASIVLGVAPGTMSPSMREAIQEAEQEAQSQYNKLLSDIKLAEVKAQLDQGTYAYKKNIDAQYKSSTTKTSSGNSTLYDDDVTDSDKKKIIKTKYTNGELDELGAIEEIYNNFDTSKIGGMLSDILGITEKEAEELYNEGIVNEYMSQMSVELGELTNNNMKQYGAYVTELLDKEYIDENFANTLLKNIDEELMYKRYLHHYLQEIQDQIEYVQKSKKLKNSNFARQTNLIAKREEEIKKAVGETRYNQLLEEVQAAEQELENAYKEKGIDW